MGDEVEKIDYSKIDDKEIEFQINAMNLRILDHEERIEWYKEQIEIRLNYLKSKSA